MENKLFDMYVRLRKSGFSLLDMMQMFSREKAIGFEEIYLKFYSAGRSLTI